jgi:hypothetical protein
MPSAAASVRRAAAGPGRRRFNARSCRRSTPRARRRPRAAARARGGPARGRRGVDHAEGGRLEVVVVHHLVDAHLDEAPRARVGADPRHAVHVVRLPRRAAPRRRPAPRRRVDEHRRDPADALLVPLGRDRALHLEQPLQPLALHHVGHVVRQVVRARPLLRAVRERADAVEAHLLHEVEEPAEVVVGLAGEADDARGADGHARHRVAEARDLLADRALALGAAHAREHRVARVLHRHVEVAHHARVRRDHLEQPRRDPRRVQVQVAVPRHAGLAEQRLEQLGEPNAVRAVAAVVREVLRHEVDLAGPLELEQLRLAHHVGRRERAVPPAHQRDRAERAPVVAPLAHLEVPHARQVAAEDPHARVRRERLGRQHAARGELRDEPVHLAGAEEQVDLGQRLGEFRLVPLHHAADRDQRLAGAVGLELPGLHDRVDRLLLGRVDEAARVHQDHLGLGHVARRGGPVGDELGEVALGVDRCSCRTRG